MLLQDLEADIGTALRGLDPYDIQMRGQLSDALFAKHQAGFSQGTTDRALFLLKVIDCGFPTERVSSSYFENLETLLGSRDPLDHEGQVILGIGPGRCGSTSLAAAFRNVDNAIATHENPPLIFWQPRREQVEFHMHRLELLRRYYSVVFDAAHWWLNVLDSYFECFPQGKVIGLHRAMESCVGSFLRVKGVDPGSPNHWALPNNGMWRSSLWDPCYPSYPVPDGHEENHFMAKGIQIQWYVDAYNQQLQELAAARPDQVMLISTESLAQSQVADRLSGFAGVEIAIPGKRYNSETLDSMAEQHAFWC